MARGIVRYRSNSGLAATEGNHRVSLKWIAISPEAPHVSARTWGAFYFREKVFSITVKRYEWLDALVEAQAMGVISNGELLTATKLSHAITWTPKGNRPSGLYWANDLAAETVGLSRSTFYDNIPKLEEHGFVVSVKGNWLPAIPSEHVGAKAEFEVRRESIKAKYEEAQKVKSRRGAKSESQTTKSESRTVKSGSRTTKSEFQYTYSVDTYPVDTYPVDEVSEETEPAASASVSLNKNKGKTGEKKEVLSSVNTSLVLVNAEPALASVSSPSPLVGSNEGSAAAGGGEEVNYTALVEALPNKKQRDTFYNLVGKTRNRKSPKRAYEHVTSPDFLDDDWITQSPKKNTQESDWFAS